MSKRKNAKGMIVPFQKKLPVVSPDEIPETASLEDYEKMAAKMAIASDDIIDKALDRMEARSQTVRQNVETLTNPQASETTENNTSEISATSREASEEDAREESNDEMDPAAELSDNLELEHLGKIKELQDTISSLRRELQTMQDGIAGKFSEEISALQKKNDDMILRNSELEFEISRLSAENLRLKQELECLRAEKILPPQTTTKEAYTRPPSRAHMPTRGPLIPELGRLRPPRRGMNGYEFWN